MNKKAQTATFTLGFGLLAVFFVLFLILGSIIPPFKESLDESRGTSSLNCPGTPGHNATAYAEDGDFNRLVRRPTCFVTGVSMVWFIVTFLIASSMWVISNWRALKK